MLLGLIRNHACPASWHAGPDQTELGDGFEDIEGHNLCLHAKGKVPRISTKIEHNVVGMTHTPARSGLA